MSPSLETPLYYFEDIIMEHQLPFEIFADSLLGKVVVGRPQPASRNDKLGALHGASDRLHDQVNVIADRSAPDNLGAGRGYRFRYESRIGVYRMAV
jgi:hypothetical protein